MLKDFVVGVFQSLKYLSHCEASKVHILDDIRRVMVADVDDDEVAFKHVMVVGVPGIKTKKSCLRCKGIVELMEPPMGCCSSCEMMQRFDLCMPYTSTQLMIKYVNN